jgi:hypothetical protein
MRISRSAAGEQRGVDFHKSFLLLNLRFPESVLIWARLVVSRYFSSQNAREMRIRAQIARVR